MLNDNFRNLVILPTAPSMLIDLLSTRRTGKSTPPTLEALGSDILYQICQVLIEDGRFGYKPKALVSLSSASKLLREIAGPILFKDISVTEKCLWGGKIDPAGPDGVEMLRRLNGRDSAILRHVRNFDLIIRKEAVIEKEPPESQLNSSADTKAFDSAIRNEALAKEERPESRSRTSAIMMAFHRRNKPHPTPAKLVDPSLPFPRLLIELLRRMDRLRSLRFEVPSCHLSACEVAFKAANVQLKTIEVLTIGNWCLPMIAFFPGVMTLSLISCRTYPPPERLFAPPHDETIRMIQATMPKSIRELSVDHKLTLQLAQVIAAAAPNLEKLSKIAPEYSYHVETILRPLSQLSKLKLLTLGLVYDLHLGFNPTKITRGDRDDPNPYVEEDIRENQASFNAAERKLLAIIEDLFGPDALLEEVRSDKDLLFERKGSGPGRTWHRRFNSNPEN